MNTIECHSLEDIADALRDGWTGCRLDKQTMIAVVDLLNTSKAIEEGALCPVCKEYTLYNGECHAATCPSCQPPVVCKCGTKDGVHAVWCN